MSARLLVPLGGPADGPGLVLLHPAGGGVTPYFGLATHLAGRYRISAVRASGLLPGEAPDDTAQAMADRYLPLLLDEDEPVLFGWSLGGLVAHELAVRFAAAGRRCRVVLVDSSLDIPPLSTVDLPGLRDRIAATGGLSLDGPEASAVRVTVDAHLRAVFGYRPSGSHPFPALLFSAGEPARERLGDWARYAPDLRTERLAGEHFDVFRPDNLGVVLRATGDFLRGEAVAALRTGEETR